MAANRPRRKIDLADAQARSVPNFEANFFASLGLKVQDDPFDKPYQQHPWVYACLTAIATAIAQTPYRIVQEVKGRKRPLSDSLKALKAELPRVHEDDREMIARTQDVRARARMVRAYDPGIRMARFLRAVGDVEPIESGPWYDLFRDVNPVMTRSQLWEATLINYNGEGGECFWVLEGRNKGVEDGEIPTEIWPMSNRGWKAVINKRTRLPEKWILSTWIEGVEHKQEFAPEQIIRFRRYNPYDAIKGTSPYDALKRELEQDHHASLFNTAYFKNGAQIGGYAFFDRRMTPDQRKDFLQMLEGRHRGSNKAWRPAVFEGGVKFEESKANHRTMQFKELREWVREACFITYRVPKSILGIGSYDTKATALTETRNFWETNLLPQVQYMEDLLASDLFRLSRTEGQGIFGMFDLSTVPALREDLSEKTNVAKTMVEIGYPLNEVNERLELGMEDQPWGDVWYKPNGTTDITKPEPEPDPAADAPKDRPAGAEANPDDEEASDKSDFTAMRIAGASAYWRSLVTRLFGPGEEAFEKKLRGYLFSLRNHQLQRIDTVGGDPPSAEALAFELASWQEEMTKRLAPVYSKVFAAAYEQVTEELALLDGKGVKRAVEGDPDVKAIVDLLSRRVRRTVKTIRNHTIEQMYDVISKGGTRDDVKKAVKGAFQRYATRGKAQVIARSEASATINQARDLAFRRRGVTEWEWITAADERVRETHVIYGEGGAHRTGFNWATLSGFGGDDSAAYTLEFPTDPRAPASEVIGCRCILIAVGVST